MKQGDGCDDFPVGERHMVQSLATHACALAAGVAFAFVCGLLTTEVKTQVRSTSRAAPATEFDSALRAAMVQMDAGMCITPSGDADRDFARAMIPHHHGALEMARLELLYGRDVRLRRLAQGMVIEQSQEIELLRSILASGSAISETSLSP
jgi:uncharacterized protein (DUF305 family)